MAERAHPEIPGFKDTLLGLKKSKYKQALYKRYGFCNKYIRNKVVLDIPCGVGWGTSLLKGAREIYGLDVSEEAITYARKHFQKNNIQFRIGDMTSLDFNDNFIDVIICLEGYEHVSKEIGLNFLDEAKRVLKKDGLIIMTVPILTNGKHSGNPYHLYEPSHEELQDILIRRFNLMYFEVLEGPDSDIVYFIGRTKEYPHNDGR